MKLNINGSDESPPKELDTDNLDDVHAAVIEKAEELRALCLEYDVNVAMIVEGHQKNIYSCLRVAGKRNRVLDFWVSIDNMLQNRMKGAVRLVFASPEE